MECILGRYAKIETCSLDEFVTVLEDYNDDAEVVLIDKRKREVEYSVVYCPDDSIPRPTLFCELADGEFLTVKELLDLLYATEEQDLPLAFEIEGKIEGFLIEDLDFSAEFNQLIISIEI